MKTRTFRRPSASLIISLLALCIAIGGTAYAASKINGKTLKNGTVAGKKLKKDTITGKQVNESKLGTVPKATSAETATNATNAANADDSAKVGGLTVTTVTASVDIPNFGVGANQCNTDQVAVPGAVPGDVVAATPLAEPTWPGDDQTAITVHSVPEAGQVEVQGCLSPDASTPVDPTPTDYKFVIVH